MDPSRVNLNLKNSARVRSTVTCHDIYKIIYIYTAYEVLALASIAGHSDWFSMGTVLLRSKHYLEHHHKQAHQHVESKVEMVIVK